MLLAANAEFELWCVADEQITDSELQLAVDWACGKGRKIIAKLRRTNLAILEVLL